MNKPTFTQGPWAIGAMQRGNKWLEVVWTDDRATSSFDRDTSERIEVHTSNARANARLIASAPELFEQCKLFEKVLTELAHEGEPEAMEMRNELRELLAKVEGET